MKILLISSYFGNVIGGALNFIKVITKELTFRGHTVTLLLDDRYKGLFSEQEFDIRWYSSIKISSYSPSFSFLKIISKIDADVIHLHGFLSFQTDFGALIGFLRKIPIILIPHGSLLGYDHLYNSFSSKIPYRIHNLVTLKLTTKLPKNIVANSKSEYDDCVAFGIPKNKIKRIPISFSPPIDTTQTKKLSKKNKILFVGRIVPLKNLDVLLKSIKILKKDFPDIQFTIIGKEITGRLYGDTGYQQKIISLVDELEIKENVQFEGWKTDKELWKEYQKSDLLVLSSTYESFGLPLLEAASFGIPLVSSDVGVAHELIGKNEGGTIISKIDEFEYANEIKKLLKNEIRYESCSKYVKKSTQNFSIKSIVDQYEKEGLI
jgi:glycosyltransferase involved in cell wall biosynthesis